MRILFVCTRNACRSQMAEAIARSLGGAALRCASAGTDPGVIDPLTLEVLEEDGIDTRGLIPKSLAAVGAEAYDWVVTLCAEADRSCPALSGRRGRLHWPIEDPARVTAGGAARLRAFRDAREEIRRRLGKFLADPERSR